MSVRSGATALLALVSSGCGPASTYAPTVVGPGELTLRYEEGIQVYAGRELLTEGPVYEGLSDFVRCVPRAHMHAEAARRDGRARRGLAWAGGTLGVVSLGGLAGLAYLDRDRSTAFGLLGAGVGVVAVALVLSGTSRILGNSAHGNAIDALNYYNDAVGSLGGTCAHPPAAGPVPVPTPAPRLEALPAEVFTVPVPDDLPR